MQKKIKNYASGQNSTINKFYNIKNTRAVSGRRQLNLSSGGQLDQYQNFIFSILKCLIFVQ